MMGIVQFFVLQRNGMGWEFYLKYFNLDEKGKNSQISAKNEQALGTFLHHYKRECDG